MNAYVVAGAVFAVWAVLISLAGMRGFPSSKGGQTFAVGVAALLFVGAVGSAIADSTKVGERKGKEVEQKPGATEKAPQSAPPATESQNAPPGATGHTDLALAADPTGQLKFDKTALEAKVGTVKITLTNASPVPHNVSLRGNGANEHSDNISGGKTASIEGQLQPGSYEFYCSIPGHEQAGMKGTLTVK